MLIVKPSLKGDEPLDILQYQAQHIEFPQETTLDQFFDEAQMGELSEVGNAYRGSICLRGFRICSGGWGVLKGSLKCATKSHDHTHN
ncbi:MAG: hypothetical protein ABI612_15210 [Betaproteobacteria bacterium]